MCSRSVRSRKAYPVLEHAAGAIRTAATPRATATLGGLDRLRTIPGPDRSHYESETPISDRALVPCPPALPDSFWCWGHIPSYHGVWTGDMANAAFGVVAPLGAVTYEV